MAVQNNNPDRAIRSSTGKTRPVLWHSQGNPNRAAEVMQFNAPTLHFGPIPARFWRPEEPPTEGRQALIRCLNRPSEWSFRNPFGMTGGDPKHTRAERVGN